ncbi:ATP-binding protein [Peribacillus tepidiphilus]|uniref:ATP-binding protein n=1 Tax=Peribacillus tepidiphilus TaxID=2652445 RepID=UPI001290F46C|nr:ATP-binding protein [Peribacillus tepidiphilus]
MSHPHKIAFKIFLVYVIIGVAWIIVTDQFSIGIAYKSLQDYFLFQRTKGWFYIFITGIILYIMIYKRTAHLIQSQNELLEKEHQLQRSNQHYQSLFYHNPDGVFELDREGKVIAANPQGEKIIGIPFQYFQSKTVTEFISKRDLTKCRKYFQEVLTGSAKKFELHIKDFNQKNKIVRVTLLPIIIDDEIIGLFAIARDITNYRREEELMISSEKMSAIGHLAAAVAHEVRNPLTSLRGFIQLMKDTNTLNPSYLEIMLSEVDRINLIASEMLILGKKQEVHYKQEDLKEIVKQVLVLMEAQANMVNAELTIHEESDGPIWINGDRNQLKQVFINLIRNSLEAIKEKGSIDILLKKQDQYAYAIIKDNGIGMNKERLKHIREPFFSTKENGTGLGLAVCYKIIERHDGAIEFESMPHVGTTVHIRLPLYKEPRQRS